MLTKSGESMFRQYRCALFLLALSTCAGCDDWEWDWGLGDAFPVGRCQMEPFAVDGVWTIQGEGNRDSCVVASRNGTLRFRTTPWEVRQFFDNPNKPGCSTLSVSTRNVVGGVEEAETRGDDVIFSTWETFEYADGTEATVELRWYGTRGTEGRFAGTIRGTSTDGCNINGTFSATIAR